jgi:crooked neck
MASNMPRTTRVKNKAPAPVQITAEQIVREASERAEEVYKAPKRKIADADELREYRYEQRKNFEDRVRSEYWQPRAWIRYAKWEEQQGDLPRARSVWERALEHHSREVPIWSQYAEMEMKAKAVNHARNVWERACGTLPRVDMFWYKYIHMEETLGQVAACRQIFEKWLTWEPEHPAWYAYVKLEQRYKENARARDIFQRYVQVHPDVKAWTRWAKFEFAAGDREKAREVYEAAVEFLKNEPDIGELYTMFARFEEMCHEVERARAIYKFALDNLPKEQAEEVYKEFMKFEKMHGNREGIEDVVVGQRRFKYEEEVAKNPLNYDTWFDYVRLEESAGDIAKTREVYERAIANVPPANEKRFWQRYIYLWINYALYEELEARDAERTREVYRACLKVIPHSEFSFSKVWIMSAKFELRQRRLDACRKILGLAIGLAPKEKIFKAYIDIEFQLGNVDRCRTIYEKALEVDAQNCSTWVQYAELERSLGEVERGRAIFELAVDQPMLDMPEVLWKAYIDFETSEGERERTRALYERLLERTKHVKVWMSYARFEATPIVVVEDDADEAAIAAATAAAEDDEHERLATRQSVSRAVYERALEELKESSPDAKEERVMLLEAWKSFEDSLPSEYSRAADVKAKMPKRVKRKRAVTDDSGHEVGQEEFYDYVFPDDASAKTPALKILEAAYAWKKQKAANAE